jgi:hypothetical protein
MYTVFAQYLFFTPLLTLYTIIFQKSNVAAWESPAEAFSALRRFQVRARPQSVANESIQL